MAAPPRHERPLRCIRCSRSVHPGTRSRQRGRALADDIGTIEARGLCGRCYHIATKDDTLADYARQLRTSDEVMSDWEMLREQGFTKRQAAARIGMTWVAFDRAFHRAKKLGDPRALPALTPEDPGGQSDSSELTARANLRRAS